MLSHNTALTKQITDNKQGNIYTIAGGKKSETEEAHIWQELCVTPSQKAEEKRERQTEKERETEVHFCLL